MKPSITPIALCLLAGIGLAIVLTSRPDPKTAPRLQITNAATNTATNAVTNMVAFWVEGYSNIVARKLAATNAQERAAWEAIEKQYTNMDWPTISKALNLPPTWRPSHGATNP